MTLNATIADVTQRIVARSRGTRAPCLDRMAHNTYDAALYLGICDKIVPGLVIAAAAFHIPAVFLPAGR